MADKSKADVDLKTNSETVDKVATEAFSYRDYFVSEEASLIFVLVYVDGEQRAKLLGITEDMYESLAKARKWRDSLVKIIHSDSCNHLLADKATSKLNDIYSRMKKYAD